MISRKAVGEDEWGSGVKIDVRVEEGSRERERERVEARIG
jgi:hypothetical protein